MLHYCKRYCFITLSMIGYLLLMGTVFRGSGSLSNIGTTIGLQIVLFILLFLALLPLTYEIIWRSILVIGVWGMLLSLISYWRLGLQHMTYIGLTHLTIIGFLCARYFHKKATKKRYIGSTAYQGLSIVSILLSLTYTTTIWVAGTSVHLDCNDLHNQSIGLITKFIPWLSWDTKSSILSTIQHFANQSIGTILGTNEKLESGAILNTDTDYNNPEISVAEWSLWSGTLLWSLLTKQEKFINDLINNQTIINDKICDLTLTHINELAQQNNIQLIVFVFLTLLIYVFMNSIVLIVGLINAILFIILTKTKRFYKNNETSTIEVISTDPEK